MRVLLDTNVVMDFLVERDGFDDAKKIITATTNQEMFECILATAVTDIAYLMRVNTNPKVDYYKIQDTIAELLKVIDILPVTKQDIFDALSLRWKDFEDALQYTVARTNGCDCIITNNIRDFEEKDIEVLKPSDFIEKYISENEVE